MVYAFIVGVYFAILFRNRTKGFTLVMCTHMFLNLIAGLSSLSIEIRHIFFNLVIKN